MQAFQRLATNERFNFYWAFSEVIASLCIFLSVFYRIMFVMPVSQPFAEVQFIILDVFLFIYLLIDNFLRYGLRRKVHPSPSSYNNELVLIGDWQKDKVSSRSSVFFVALDLLSLLPLSYVAYFVGWKTPFLLLFFQLLYLYHMPRAISLTNHYWDKHQIIQSVYVRRVIWLYVFFFMVTHLSACAFFCTSCYTLRSGQPSWAENDGMVEIVNGQVFNAKSRPFVYLRTFYWSAMTTVSAGYGDISPINSAEFILSFISFTVGYVFIAAFLAAITNMMLVSGQDEDELNMYMDVRKLPLSMQYKFRSYYQYTWSLSRGLSEDSFSELIPSVYRTQVAGMKTRDLLLKIPYFRNSDESFLNALIMSLKPTVFSPGDEILGRGKLNRNIYFFTKGEADMIGYGSKVLKRYGKDKDCIYGDLDIFREQEMTAIIRAKSYCEIYILYSDAFQKIKEKFLTDEQYQKMLEISEKMIKQQAKLNKLLGEVEEETLYKGWREIFLPTSNFRAYWNLLLFCTILYNVIMIPYRAAYFYFYQMSGMYAVLTGVDTLADIIFMIDILFRFNYFAYMEDGIVVCVRRQIRRHYLSNIREVVSDFICVLPVEYFAYFFDERFVTILRLLKLIRVAYLPQYAKGVLLLLESCRINVSQAVIQIVAYYGFILVLTHFLAAMWFFLGHFLKHNYSNADNWIDRDNTSDDIFIDHSVNSESAGYLRAIYFILQVGTTVGYDDLIPVDIAETDFTVLVVLTGGILFPGIVAAIAALLMRVDALKQDFKHKITTLRVYMENRKYSPHVKKRVIRYFDYLWNRQRGIDEVKVLHHLPPPLRTLATEFTIKSTIQSVPFLMFLDKELLKEIYAHILPMIYLPDDIIVQAHEIGDGMYFLEHGMARSEKPLEIGVSHNNYLEEFTAKANSEDETYFIDILREKDQEEDTEIGVECPADAGDPKQANDSSRFHEKSSSKLIFNIRGSEKSGDETARRQSRASTATIEFVDDEPVNRKVSVDLSKATVYGFHYEKSFFGSSSAVNIKSPTIVRAVNFCECFFLSKSSLIATLNLFPESRDAFISEVNDYFGKQSMMFQLIDANLHKDKINKFIGNRNIVKEQVGNNSFRNPDSRKRRFWSLLCLITMIYNMFVVPLTLVVFQTPNPVAIAFNWAFDLVIIADFFLRLFFFSFMLNGQLVSDSSQIANNRIKERTFLIDLIAMLPLDIIFVIIYYSRPFPGVGMSAIYGIRALKLLWMFHYFEALDSLSRLAEDYTFIHESFPSLLALLLNVVLFAHWVSCLFVLMGKYYQNFEFNYTACSRQFDLTNNTIVDRGLSDFGLCVYRHTWIHKLAAIDALPPDGGSEGHQYLRSLYWSVGTLLVVVGDTTPMNFYENVACVIIILIGVVVNATILGGVSNASASMNKEDMIQQKLNDLELYFDLHQIPRLTAEKCMDYIKYVSYNAESVHEYDLMKDLPDTLRNEVFQERGVPFVIRCPIFKDMDMSFIRHLAQKLIPVVFLPGDVVYQESMMHKYMYFIEKGEVEISRSYSKLNVQNLLAGDTFGELSIFYNMIPRETAKSLDYTECFRLSREDIDYLVTNYNVDISRLFRSVSRHAMKSEHNRDDEDDDEEDELYRRQSKKEGLSSRFETFQISWHLMGYIVSFYYYISIPFQVAFHDNGAYTFHFKDQWFTIMVDLIGLVYYYADMILKYKYFPYTDHGKMVSDPVKIRQHYLKGDFFLDVLMNLPLEIAGFVYNPCYPFVRLIHMLHLFRYSTYSSYLFDTIHSFSKYIKSYTLQVVDTVILFILSVHIASCCEFVIHRFLSSGEPFTWAIKDGLSTFDPETGYNNIKDPGISLTTCYLHSFFYALDMMSTVSYGNMKPYTTLEVVFQILLSIFTSAYQGVTIGVLGGYYEQDDNTGETAFETQMHQIQDYMEYRQLPPALKDSITFYFNQLWISKKRMIQPNVVHELPREMQLDIEYDMKKGVLQKLDDLYSLPLAVQRSLLLSMNLYFCRENEVLYRIGEISEGVFFIIHGKVCVSTASGSKEEYIEGECFGKEVLGPDCSVRKSGARAIVTSELLIIYKRDLFRTLIDFPDIIEFPLFEILYKQRKNVLVNLPHELSELSGDDSTPTVASPLVLFSKMNDKLRRNRARISARKATGQHKILMLGVGVGQVNSGGEANHPRHFRDTRHSAELPKLRSSDLSSDALSALGSHSRMNLAFETQAGHDRTTPPLNKGVSLRMNSRPGILKSSTFPARFMDEFESMSTSGPISPAPTIDTDAKRTATIESTGTVFSVDPNYYFSNSGHTDITGHRKSTNRVTGSGSSASKLSKRRSFSGMSSSKTTGSTTDGASPIDAMVSHVSLKSNRAVTAPVPATSPNLAAVGAVSDQSAVSKPRMSEAGPSECEDELNLTSQPFKGVDVTLTTLTSISDGFTSQHLQSGFDSSTDPHGVPSPEYADVHSSLVAPSNATNDTTTPFLREPGIKNPTAVVLPTEIEEDSENADSAESAVSESTELPEGAASTLSAIQRSLAGRSRPILSIQVDPERASSRAAAGENHEASSRISSELKSPETVFCRVSASPNPQISGSESSTQQSLQSAQRFFSRQLIANRIRSASGTHPTQKLVTLLSPIRGLSRQSVPSVMDQSASAAQSRSVMGPESSSALLSPYNKPAASGRLALWFQNRTLPNHSRGITSQVVSPPMHRGANYIVSVSRPASALLVPAPGATGAIAVAPRSLASEADVGSTASVPGAAVPVTVPRIDSSPRHTMIRSPPLHAQTMMSPSRDSDDISVFHTLSDESRKASIALDPADASRDSRMTSYMMRHIFESTGPESSSVYVGDGDGEGEEDQRMADDSADAGYNIGSPGDAEEEVEETI